MRMDGSTSGLLRWVTTHPTRRQGPSEVRKGGTSEARREDPFACRFSCIQSGTLPSRSVKTITKRKPGWVHELPEEEKICSDQ